ncbi:MAG: beta-galactosidase [Epulopiscium sp.]|nr:beta-galactosidase [Candidatus Epulonipiscium sp.]
MKNKLYHGAAYYPELWDKSVIDEDIKYMKKAGINVIRMGEFAWAKMEPVEGQIDVSFFVDIIKKFYAHGIDTIMCTPTPTPPIWMSYGHPERMYVEKDGTVMSHGARQHICTNNSYFRERARIITEKISKVLGNLPGLIAWQLDNEFKCHVGECMCETCKQLWHKWLEERYGTIENLNELWGTQIWSESYLSFDQVPQPLPTPFLHNASLTTMYQIFSREKIAEFAEEQAAIIRKYSKVPITHNSCLGFRVDNECLFKNLDFAGVDGYPHSDEYQNFIVKFDRFRNVKKGRDFWVLETSTSHTGALTRVGKTHKKGYLAVEAVAAYALGAKGFCYWLFRQQRTGCEISHGSLISTWGKPTIGYAEVLEVEKTRKEIEPIFIKTKTVQAEFAITYSDRAKVFLTTENHKNLDYRSIMTDFNTDVLELGIHRDLINENEKLEGYKVLFTPFMPYVSEEYLQCAKKFAEQGGIWIIGPLTGGRTKEHTVHTNAALGNIEKIAGVETLYTYHIEGTGSRGKAFGISAELGLWSAVFKPIEAKVMGVIEGGPSHGQAFITEHQLGKGKIVMLGSMPMGENGRKMIKNVLDHYAKEAKIILRLDVSKGTIAVPRKGKDNLLWVIINMDGEGGKVILPTEGIDVLTNETLLAGVLEIGKYEYRLIQQK